MPNYDGVAARGQRRIDWALPADYYEDDEICRVCNGEGEHHTLNEETGKWEDIECRNCKGTGRI